MLIGRALRGRQQLQPVGQSTSLQLQRVVQTEDELAHWGGQLAGQERAVVSMAEVDVYDAERSAAELERMIKIFAELEMRHIGRNEFPD